MLTIYDCKLYGMYRLYTSLLFTQAVQTYWLTVRLHNDPVCLGFLKETSSLCYSVVFICCILTTWTLPHVYSDISAHFLANKSHYVTIQIRSTKESNDGIKWCGVPNLRKGHIGEFVHLQLTLLSILTIQLSFQDPGCCHCRYTHT